MSIELTFHFTGQICVFKPLQIGHEWVKVTPESKHVFKETDDNVPLFNTMQASGLVSLTPSSAAEEFIRLYDFPEVVEFIKPNVIVPVAVDPEKMVVTIDDEIMGEIPLDEDVEITTSTEDETLAGETNDPPKFSSSPVTISASRLSKKFRR